MLQTNPQYKKLWCVTVRAKNGFHDDVYVAAENIQDVYIKISKIEEIVEVTGIVEQGQLVVGL